MDKILVLDFGSQTTQLISRRIRKIGVFSEILPGDVELVPRLLKNVKGIVLSGSPHSVYEHNSPSPDPRIYDLGIPILGICYGLQRIVHDNGGAVDAGNQREYGRSRIEFKQECVLFSEIPEGFISWMSHGDAIVSIPEEFVMIAVSENGLPAAIGNVEKKIFGIQFHPEVSHCEYGEEILANFAAKICFARSDWNMKTFLAETKQVLLNRVGEHDILLLISGGVDSTVVAALLLNALNPERVYLLYIDTGLMREGETQEVLANLERLGAKHISIVDASERFYAALKDCEDPEEKRQRIGDLFIEVQEEEVDRLGIRGGFMAQGTLYTDMIESGKGVGNHASVIKSHHNVRSPLVEAKRRQNLLVEPLSLLYKDEVRELGKALGVEDAVINRHPFPGPGLAVRILGEVTAEKCAVLRQADAIFINELKARGLYRNIWQAFSVLLPIRSVGVTGDSREYGYVLALRAVTSLDAMTADVYKFNPEILIEISSKITNTMKEIGRVVYDVTSKPPSTIEWE